MSLTTFNPGDKIKSSEMNDNFTWVSSDLGEVKMFALSLTGAVTKASLQAKGWAICDGTTPVSQGISSPTITTTPDLQHKFIRMSDDESSGGTGGEDTHTLTIDEMPAHTHSQQGDTAGGQCCTPFLDGHSSSHTGASTGSTGGNQPHENKPPYYELVYFIKVK